MTQMTMMRAPNQVMTGGGLGGVGGIGGVGASAGAAAGAGVGGLGGTAGGVAGGRIFELCAAYGSQLAPGPA